MPKHTIFSLGLQLTALAPQKPSFQKKSFVTLNFKCIACKKNCEKDFEMIDNVFLKIIQEEKHKNLAEKKCCVFGGLTCETSKHTKTFFGNIFYNFL